MKVLIVDDNREKLRKVIECLESHNVSKENITIAQCVHDAKINLTKNYYDILILDLSLPERPEDEPSNTAGTRLLREIIDRDIYIKPRYITGLTAYIELFEENAGDFSDYLWTLIYFQENETAWCNALSSLIHHVNSAINTTDTHFDTDLAVICALQSPEFEALMELKWNWVKIELPRDPADYYEGTINTDNGALKVVAAVSNRMGMTSSSILASKIIFNFKPRYIAMIGICAGINEKCELGDVIVEDPAWNYQSGKINSHTLGFEIDPHQLPIRHIIKRRFDSLSEDNELLEKIKKEWPADKPRTDLKIHVGPMASGSQVIANSDTVDDIKKQQRKLIGIDMEIYGVYAAAEEAILPQPDYFSIKGVSDYANSEKSDDYQRYSAYVSAHVLKAFVEKYLHEITTLMSK